MEVKEVKRDLKRFKAVASIVNQEGGKVLIKGLEKDVLSGLDCVLSMYRGDEIELRATIAKLKADLDLLRVLKRSSKNVKIVEEELAKLLADGFEDED